MGPWSYAKIAVSISTSQYGNGGAKLQKNFAFCEKFEGNWVALRRGERPGGLPGWFHKFHLSNMRPSGRAGQMLRKVCNSCRTNR